MLYVLHDINTNNIYIHIYVYGEREEELGRLHTLYYVLL